MQHRVAILVVQAGLLAAALLALPYRLFELDRFFVPKELALHVAALAVGLLLLSRARTMWVDAADLLLAAFLTLSVLSALFATNHWLAQRALGVSVSSALVFWAARRIGADSCRPLLVGAALATVAAAGSALVQAYGVDLDWFSQNRAPGGTFGNRNFVAHFCAIGLPALVYATLTARRSAGALLGSLGVGVVAVALVLSRSRAAWLAIAATIAVLAVPLLASRKYWAGHGMGGRLARLAITAVVGVVAAVVLPNRLDWRSDSPYLDSARGMMDYRSGSGRGRLAQWETSMRVAIADPVFGAGPGNWPVKYPRFAPPADKSLTEDGMTANPWPSSDWVAYVSERGIVATAALAGVFAMLFLGALRGWSALDSEAVLTKLALAGTIAATLVVSAFDAVLLLAAPSLLAWSVIGAGSGVGRRGREVSIPGSRWVPATALMLLITFVSVARSGAQVAAIMSVGEGGTRAGWIRAAALDPGGYRISLRVAELYASRGQCGPARTYGRRAQGLFPNAAPPRRLLRRCGWQSRIGSPRITIRSEPVRMRCSA